MFFCRRSPVCAIYACGYAARHNALSPIQEKVKFEYETAIDQIINDDTDGPRDFEAVQDMVAQHLIQKYHLTDLDPGSRAEMFPFQKGLWSSDIPSERYQRLARSWNDGRMQSVAAGMAMCDDIYRDGLNQRGLSVKEQTDLTVDHGSCQNAAALPGMLILPTTYGGAATTAAVVAPSGALGVVRGVAASAVRNTTKAVSITLRTEARAIIRAEQAAAKSAARDRAVQSMSGKTPAAKKPLTPTPQKSDGGVSGSISSRSSSSSSSSGSSSSSSVDPLQKKQLLPNEGKVGTYGELRKIKKLDDNLARHHIPNDNYMRIHGIKRDDGVSMMVEQPTPGSGGRHRQIHKKLQKQDSNLKPRDALAQSVTRTREVYRQDGVYTPEIQSSFKKVIEKNKEKFPDLFNKKKD